MLAKTVAGLKNFGVTDKIEQIVMYLKVSQEEYFPLNISTIYYDESQRVINLSY